MNFQETSGPPKDIMLYNPWLASAVLGTECWEIRMKMERFAYSFISQFDSAAAGAESSFDLWCEKVMAVFVFIA